MLSAPLGKALISLFSWRCFDQGIGLEASTGPLQTRLRLSALFYNSVSLQKGEMQGLQADLYHVFANIDGQWECSPMGLFW